jgi:hypothetical protein
MVHGCSPARAHASRPHSRWASHAARWAHILAGLTLAGLTLAGLTLDEPSRSLVHCLNRKKHAKRALRSVVSSAAAAMVVAAMDSTAADTAMAVDSKPAVVTTVPAAVVAETTQSCGARGGRTSAIRDHQYTYAQQAHQWGPIYRPRGVRSFVFVVTRGMPPLCTTRSAHCSRRFRVYHF